MPCQSDYLEATGGELESQRVCQYIIYIFNKIGKDVPDWIVTAANYYYGNLNRLNEATKILCETCRSLTTKETEEIIYDAHDKTARKLATWWENHQDWDKRRVNEENAIRKKIMLKDRALKKLTIAEIKALGLDK